MQTCEGKRKKGKKNYWIRICNRRVILGEAVYRRKHCGGITKAKSTKDKVTTDKVKDYEEKQREKRKLCLLLRRED